MNITENRNTQNRTMECDITCCDSNSEYNFAVGGFISYHRFNIKEEITWTKFYCTEIVRGYVLYADTVLVNTIVMILDIEMENNGAMMEVNGRNLRKTLRDLDFVPPQIRFRYYRQSSPVRSHHNPVFRQLSSKTNDDLDI
ncbi:hypothetical protein ANN_15288 [Periplaneta americana]|uniref:Uncharacterized protein n=1 Tax=Periplaneta americana TaxID=6978 RepID=A0ABQ8SFY6_PERAM|nr:hypothetical protein ANN_15288 [Periplaneta americana]